MCSTPTVRHIKVTGLLTRGQWIYKIAVLECKCKKMQYGWPLNQLFKHKSFAYSKRKSINNVTTRLLKWNAIITFTVIHLFDTPSNSRQADSCLWTSQMTEPIIFWSFVLIRMVYVCSWTKTGWGKIILL